MAELWWDLILLCLGGFGGGSGGGDGHRGNVEVYTGISCHLIIQNIAADDRHLWK